MPGPGKVATLLEAIKFEHTIFALPFAYLGMVLAARGWPGWGPFCWITVAMVAARTLAMAANRVIDRQLDAANPRTAQRALPRGLLASRDLVLLALVALAIFFLAASQLNALVLTLTPIAAVIVVGYSYTKRFTWLSHIVLGLADAMGLVGAWLAVAGELTLPGYLLGFAVTAWIAGFDMIYACQDVDFDRRAGLYSIPARFGVAAGLHCARLMHLATAVLLLAAGFAVPLGAAYFAGCLIAIGLLVYEHRLVHPGDLSKLNMAFFNVNGYIAVIVCVAAVVGLYV
jgi:4-hydroxybenzoate polyprenyltransferase